MKQELLWMVPTGFLLLILVLGYALRSWRLVGISLFPFFTGLGMVFVVNQGEMTFISILGCYRLCGFSVDYGIFVANFEQNGNEGADEGVFTSIFLSALVNMIGFAPLMACEHPVLRDLGLTLTFASLGASIGALWLPRRRKL